MCICICVYIYIYGFNYLCRIEPCVHFSICARPPGAGAIMLSREFTKGGLVKGVLAIYVLLLCLFC